VMVRPMSDEANCELINLLGKREIRTGSPEGRASERDGKVSVSRVDEHTNLVGQEELVDRNH